MDQCLKSGGEKAGHQATAVGAVEQSAAAAADVLAGHVIQASKANERRVLKVPLRERLAVRHLPTQAVGADGRGRGAPTGFLVVDDVGHFVAAGGVGIGFVAQHADEIVWTGQRLGGLSFAVPIDEHNVVSLVTAVLDEAEIGLGPIDAVDAFSVGDRTPVHFRGLARLPARPSDVPHAKLVALLEHRAVEERRHFIDAFRPAGFQHRIAGMFLGTYERELDVIAPRNGNVVETEEYLLIGLGLRAADRAQRDDEDGEERQESVRHGSLRGGMIE